MPSAYKRPGALACQRCGIRAYHSLYPRSRALALILTWAGPNSAPKELSKGEDCPALISNQELWLVMALLHKICNRTKSVLRANSPQVLVSSRYTLIHQIPNPKIIFENSFSRYHPNTWNSWPSKRVNIVRKHFHFIKVSFGGQNRTFLMHRILRLKASAEHTQFRKLEVSVSLLTQIISLIPRRERKGFRET